MSVGDYGLLKPALISLKIEANIYPPHLQIEPDIIDYDGDDHSSSTDTGPTHGDSAAPSDLNRDVFTCSHCYERFGRQTAFLSHLVSAHLSSARFEGVDTGTETFPQEDLERGYAVVRYASRVKYLCLSCGKQFIKEEHIGDHIKVHFQDGVYNCLHCDRVFSSYDVYETHVDSHRIHCQHVSLTLSRCLPSLPDVHKYDKYVILRNSATTFFRTKSLLRCTKRSAK